MKVKRFLAPNMQTALRQIALELGDDAVILSRQKTAHGLEVVAALDYEPERGQHEIERQLQLQDELDRAKQEMLSAAQQTRVRQARQADVSSREGIAAALKQLKQPSFSASAHTELVPPVVTTVPELTKMQNELRELKQLLLAQKRPVITASTTHCLQEYCQTLGLLAPLTGSVFKKIPARQSSEQAQRQLHQLLAQHLPVSNHKIMEQGGRLALVGPTGAGKTTTIGKIAAQFVLRHGPDSVALVTLDSYRVAAHDQLRSFAKILGVELKIVPPSGDLNKELDALRHKKLVLVDTAGLSKQDPHFTTQLDMLKRTGLRLQKLLVLPLTSQGRCLQESYAQLKQMELHGCIFTKLDECFSLGAALSMAIIAKLPVQLVTNGPHIPHDIHYPNAAKLVALAARMTKANPSAWLNHGLNYSESKTARYGA